MTNDINEGAQPPYTLIQGFPARQIYLAGPITGLDYEDAANGWRKTFPEMLRNDPHIHCFSPMRGKNHLDGLATKITDREANYPYNPISTASAIVARDHNDVMTCDAMVANFIGAPRASLGTAIEFGWAHSYKKPIIMIVEDDGSNVHDHLMLTDIAGYRVHSLEDAAVIIRHLFTPGL